MKKFLHFSVWTIFFFKGVIEFTGLFPSILNLLAISFIFLLFIETFSNSKRFYPFISLFILLTIASFVSGPILNDIGFTEYFFFLRQLFLLPLLYLIVIVNERNDDLIRFIIKLIIFYFALQIPASWIKLIILGGPGIEMFVGTVSWKQGSMTTVISMIGCFYNFSKYLYLRSKKYLLYFFLFVIFSQIGGKRAVLVFVPLGCLFISIYYAKLNHIPIKKYLKLIPILISFLFIFFYLIVRLNPTLNKEHQVWGSFDLNYTLSYFDFYNNNAKNLYDLSRGNALKFIGYYIINQPIDTILFGEGAGKLSESKLGANPMRYYYGIRYGARMGLAWIGLQLGVVGTYLYFLIFKKMFHVVRKHKSRNFHKLIFTGIFITVLLDTLIYSMSSIQYFVSGGLLFAYFGIFYRDIHMKRNVLNE
jgi:hypothetical protein